MRYPMSTTLVLLGLAIGLVVVVPLDLLAYGALISGPVLVLSALVGVRDL